MASDCLADKHMLDLQYLQSELARLDVRLRRQVLLWERAGQDAHDAYRGLYVTAETVNRLLARPLGGNWGAAASLAAEEEAAFAQAELAAIRQTHELAEKAQRSGCSLRLERLQAAFGLDAIDREILLLGLAAAIDLRYEQVFAFLQDDITRKLPTANLALDLLAKPGVERLLALHHFDDSAPLFRHGLLRRVAEARTLSTSLLASAFLCDECVAGWLAGSYCLSAEQALFMRLYRPEQATGACFPLDSELCAELAGALKMPAPLLVFSGPDVLAQQAAAQWLAYRAGKMLMTVAMGAAVRAGQTACQVVNTALRDALLLDAVTFFYEWDGLAAEQMPATPIAEALERHPGLVIVAPLNGWPRQGETHAKRALHYAFPTPGACQRAQLWRHFLASARGHDDPIAVDEVAAQFVLTAAQIRDAAATALDLAGQEGYPVAAPHLRVAARVQSTANFSGLARKIEPHPTWEDLVLPADCMQQMREICDRINHRQIVHEEWGFASRLALKRGLNVLFAGVSGTGKTMSASVLAHELGLDLYKIDLSNVVSKYIGETEKSLARIFAEAETSNAILFFDEADALFGKRSAVQDAHDRYANVETSYLLQRMEEYDGLAILATNFRQNLDEAFIRRLHHIVEFPMPDVVERRRIWEQIWPQSSRRSADLDLEFLAERLEISGGVIRNTALTAAFLAAANGGEIGMKHVIGAVQREYRKMGRILFESELGQYARYARSRE